MNDLPPDVLSRVITCIERAGDMLVAEFHRIPWPLGHGDKGDLDQERRRIRSRCSEARPADSRPLETQRARSVEQLHALVPAQPVERDLPGAR